METSRVYEVAERLKINGDNRHGNPTDPIDDLVYIILSSQTEEYAYQVTFQNVKDRFPSWDKLLEVPVQTIAASIAHGGLQQKKARFIQQTLRKLKEDFGEISLSSLENDSNSDVLRYLKSLPGLSAKSARCIMMYTMGRTVFPVDTHVWRISRRLGWTPVVPKPTEKQQVDLENQIPPELRFSLHVNMVSHGRSVCTTYWPKCEDCALADICPSKGKPDETWGMWRKPKGAWAGYTNTKKTEP